MNANIAQSFLKKIKWKLNACPREERLSPLFCRITDRMRSQTTHKHFCSSLSHLFVLFLLVFLFDFQSRSNHFLWKFYSKLNPGLGRMYGIVHYMVLLANREMHQLARLYMITWEQLKCVSWSGKDGKYSKKGFWKLVFHFNV